MAITIDQLKADVAAQTDVINSNNTLLSGLSTQLADAIAKAKQTGDMSGLDDLHASIVANTASLSAAVAANTPAPAPTPPADPTAAPTS